MGTKKYAIGLDFGTESGRAVLVDVADGREVATAVHPYGDGVIDEVLPGTDVELPQDFALQNPADYVEVLQVTIPAVLEEGDVDASDVIGIGTDFSLGTYPPHPPDPWGAPDYFKDVLKNFNQLAAGSRQRPGMDE